MTGDASYRSPLTKGGWQTVHRLQNATHPRLLNQTGPDPYRPLMNQPIGFTLIELVVTIAIAGILLALAVPSFRNTVLNNQRAARVNEFMADLAHARSQAVALRRTVVMCRTNAPFANFANGDTPCGTGNGWEEGWIVFEDSNQDRAVNADAMLDRDGGGISASDAVLRRHAPLIASSEFEIADNQKFTLRGNGLASLDVRNAVTFRPSGLAVAGTIVACDRRGSAHARAVVIGRAGRIRSENGLGDASSCHP